MEILLLENVAKCGTKGSVANVNPGYAQFLINTGKARAATGNTKEQALKATEHKARHKAERDTKLAGALQELSKHPLTIKAKANEQGHLFEGVTAAKVAQALSKKSGVDVSDTAVELPHNIKETGEHTLNVKTASGIKTVTIVIESE